MKLTKTMGKMATVLVALTIIGTLHLNRSQASEGIIKGKGVKSVTKGSPVGNRISNSGRIDEKISDIPQVLSYHGYLESNGSPVNGTKNMTFKIWDSQVGGQELWSETHSDVQVLNGHFSVTLGLSNPIPLDLFTGGAERWIEITVEGEVLSPRTQISSVGYGFVSKMAESAELWNNHSWGDLYPKSDTANNANKLDNYDTGNLSGNIPINNGVRCVDLNADLLDGYHYNELPYADTNHTHSLTLSGDVSASGNIDNTINVNVIKIRNMPVSSATPALGQVLKWSGFQWEPSNDNVGSSYWTQTDAYIYPNDSTWSVGIGTYSPTHRFHVQGNVGAALGYFKNTSTSSNSKAIYAECSNNGMGVYGKGAYIGVKGENTSGDGTYNYGVYGTASGGNSNNIGVYGSSSGSGSTYGLYGYSNGTGVSYGVYGEGNDYGVYGESPRGHGVYGRGKWGIMGYGDTLYGVSGVSAIDIGVYGNGPTYGVYCEGDFAATGTKSALVKTKSGPVELYAMESPEVWFEDFGSGRLENGHAHIELKEDFLETVTINKDNPMKVFVQLKDDCNGVYVKTGKTGFDVYELRGGKSNAEFDYRVIAKRKGYEKRRMRIRRNLKYYGMSPRQFMKVMTRR